MTIETVIQQLSDIFNSIIPLLVLLATALFLWGIVKYITAGGDEEKLREARNLIVWGIVFLSVIVAVWGFVNIIIDFIFGTNTIHNIPGGDIVETL